MIFYDGGKRQREGHTLENFWNLLKLSFVETKQKNKKCTTSHKKKQERESKSNPPKKTKKQKKTKKAA